MNKIRALILTFVLAFVGLVAVGSNVASAGGTVPDGDCSTTAVAGNRVCYDISQQRLFIYTDAWTIYASTQNRLPIIETPADPEPPQSGPPPVPFYISNNLPSVAPLGGWLSWDWECGAIGTTSGMPYGPSNNYQPVYWMKNAISGFPEPWYYFSSWDDAFSDTVAWVLNSNTGYECVTVN